jgi:hypothetical protein
MYIRDISMIVDHIDEEKVTGMYIGAFCGRAGSLLSEKVTLCFPFSNEQS